MTPPLQLILAVLTLAVAIVTPIIAYAKASGKIDAKSEDHEKRIEGVEKEVHGLREHVIETRNDVKWIKEAIRKNGEK